MEVKIGVICLIGAILCASASPIKKSRSSADILQAIYNDVQKVKNGTTPNDPCDVCYDELGCFDACKGTFKYIGLIPETPEKIATTFTLYIKNNAAVTFTHKDISAIVPLLTQSRIVMFVVHGFSATGTDDWIMKLKDDSIVDDDAAYISVDWSKGSAFPWYSQAVVNTDLVGREIAVVVQKMMQAAPDHVNPGLVHLVGHSLGAQIGKFFGEYLVTLTGIKPQRITALDAAAPLFEDYGVCLSSSDANFVDGIHTSAGDSILTGKMGVTQTVGHLDLYVNGGSSQPGCGWLDLTCSHSRSHDYYIEAAKDITTCIFKSYGCEGGRSQYLAGKCEPVPNSNNEISLDQSLSLPGRGIEFVDTNSAYPYCK